MKIFNIISVARQVDGEYVVVKVEKAFKKASDADEYMKKMLTKYAESIQTGSGLIQCVCERGIFETEVDD